MKQKELTVAETIVMKCIWDSDHEMGLSEILQLTNEKYGRNWKSQTVSTYLAKLVQKGFIKMKRQGRHITYEILILEKAYTAAQAKEFVAFWYGGSLSGFLEAFYDGETVSAEEIDELQGMLDRLAR